MTHLLTGSKLTACNYLRKSFEQDPHAAKQHVHAICDELLNPKDLSVDRSGHIEWLKALFACYSSGNYQEFCNKLRHVDSSPLCGCVWTANFVAYRCRTCATSPCMSLCAACFEQGNHQGHDYNIFRSEAGGACDCGDSSVMQKTGFCSHHGPNRVMPDPLPPAYLNVAKVVLDRMVLFLVHVLRKLTSNILTPETFQISFPSQLNELFGFLLELIKLGSVIRSYLGDILLDEILYLDLFEGRGYKCVEDRSNPICLLHNRSIDEFVKSVQTFREPLIPEEIKDKNYYNAVKYKRYLDELAYWTVRYEFPEPLILILLNLLPDLKIKQEFARSFTQHYSRIAVSLSNSADVAQLSNRVVHISVQLFSNDEIAIMLTNNERLLQIFMIASYNIVNKMLAPSRTSNDDFHQCVMSQSEEVQNNAYWPIFSDFINVLSHKQCALKFLGDPDLVNLWVQLLVSFSGMDLVHREMYNHVEFETNQSLLGFYTEREACASPLWSVLDVLQDSSTAHLSLSMCNILLTNGLVEFFDALNFNDKLPFDQLSFHYPLHRYFALLISNALYNQGVSLNEILIAEDIAMKIIQHPLHVLVTMYEIQCGMWIRNGVVLSTQSLAYKQYFFCTFFIDADVYLLQFCSLILPPDVLITNVFERCRINHCLTLNKDIDISQEPLAAPDEDRRPKMLESAFLLLASLICIRTNTGSTMEEIMESEAVFLLTSQDCTYSTLQDHIPQCHESHSGSKTQNNTKMLSKLLEKLSVKKEGGAMEQTTYVPNDRCWQLYDPIFSQHRVLYKRHIHQAHKNYCSHLISKAHLAPGFSDTELWPPYKEIIPPKGAHSGLVKLLHCPTLHAFIYIVLFKSLHEHEVVTDNTLALCLHLLEASLKIPPPITDMSSRSTRTINWPQSVPLNLRFDSSDIKINIFKVVDHVEAVSATDQNLPVGSRSTSSESMLSLLLKLFDKFSKAPGSFSLDEGVHMSMSHDQLPPTRSNVVGKVLKLAAMKSMTIKNNIGLIYKTIHPHPMTSSSVTSSGEESATAERNRRRQEAKNAQMRMMKQIQEQQKQFLKNQIPEVLEDAAMAEEANVESYECCICGSSEVDADIENTPNTFGIICVVQPSFVLGHKKSGFHRIKTQPASAWQEVDTFATVCKSPDIKVRFDILQSRNNNHDGDCYAPLGGAHVTTCGHHVHIKCHADYMSSVHQEQLPYLMDGRYFFKCPMCRQLSNLVLKCPASKPSGSQNPPSFSIAESYNGVKAKCRDCLSGSTLNNVYTAFLSIFEHVLLQLGGSLLSPEARDISKSVLKLSVERKIPTDALCHMLIREVDPEEWSVSQIWSDLLTKGVGSIQCVRIPALYADPSALFVKLIMDALFLDKNYEATPFKECDVISFQNLVQKVYNLAFVQALVQSACKFSDHERSGWKSSSTGMAFTGDNLECLLAHVIRSLPPKLLAESNTVTTQPFSTVYTQESVFTLVEDYVLHFMQIASLVQYHLVKSGNEFPLIRRGRKEFTELAIYLGLCPMSDSGDVNVLQCLKWESDPKPLISCWCRELLQKGGTSYSPVYRTLTSSKTWFSPKLIDLPEEYRFLFLMFRQQKCTKCGEVPKEPAICLVCGAYVCYKSLCSPNQGQFAASRHARRCGAGTGIFLLINTCNVVILRGHRFCYWGTLYLDAHGEVDRDWARGKPLFLKKERLLVLERQWINHSFDNSCKNWMLHHHKL